MRGPQPDPIRLSAREREDLERLLRRHTTSQQIALRVRMILAAAEGANNSQIARQLRVDYEMVSRWRHRWIGLQAAALEDLPVEDRLSDAPRPGRPAETHSRTNLSNRGLGLRAANRPPHQSVDGTRIGRGSGPTRHRVPDFWAPCQTAVKKGDLKPHLIRYWLTPPSDEHLEEKVTDICTLYREAPALSQQGEQVLSTDELTGVQAIERKHPGLPRAMGKVERREFEYLRHGTSAFILSRDVVTGKPVAPWCGPTRTEEDLPFPCATGGGYLRRGQTVAFRAR